MKKDHNGNRYHWKGCAVALGTDSPPVTFPHGNRWGWARGRERAVGHEVPRAAQGDLYKNVHRAHISCLSFSTVCPTHTQGSLWSSCLPCTGLRCIKGQMATGLQLLGPRGLWVPVHSEAQVSPNWPFEASSPRPENSIFWAEWPSGTGTWHIAQMADNVESQVTESIPCSASIKTQEFLQPEPASPCVPSSLSLLCTGGQRWTREGALNTTSAAAAQT